jgi:HAD superfamily hydrolase (TIGR01509 family)
LTRGTADPDAFARGAAERFDCSVSPDQLTRFRSLVEHERDNLLLYWDTVAALTALKRSGYRLALVSNTWAFPIERLRQQTPLGRLFDHWVCSCDVGRAKPHADIFEALCRRCRARPAQVVMVGDNYRLDVAGALAHGLHAVHLDRADRTADPQRCRGVRVIRTLSELLDQGWRGC